ncbi:SnoaL-like polyketide cyclase [Rivularia sp. PCC 7116]|uniref:nuclear transport factor 2 family protein n=1 Tax=Rivularia sp. PCC 7116 TaxID=373994 RepID=UPI00029F0D71|nr:nuclear transport factor 2 family protein [Rivularia sp. PCC 7116]AFY56995.1 SnoaL-like polyketide cyclase [Rivularia sp. PCC 7116]
MSPEQIESIVNSYLENMSAMNAQGWVENFAEDALSYDPVGEPPTVIHEGFQEFIGQLQAVFAQLEVTKEHIFIAGNEAAVKWTMRGVSKTQKTVSVEGITVLEINDAGKIQTTRAYWNPKTIIAQLRS